MIYFLIFLLISFLLFPMDISKGASVSLSMCLNSVIPSLFPFMVMSKILFYFIKDKENIFTSFVSKVFKISEKSATVLIVSLLCGYPIGAKMISSLLCDKSITKSEAKRLYLFCNNAGPSFVLGTVGSMFFNSAKTGVIIYLSHIFSSLLIGIVLSFYAKDSRTVSNYKNNSESFSAVFTNAVSDGVASILHVTGIIVFFSTFTSLFCKFSFLPQNFIGILSGLFEMTNGISKLVSSNLPYYIKVSFSTFLVSFSGVSIFFQLNSFCPQINIMPCVIFKALSGVTGLLLSVIAIKYGLTVLAILFIFLSLSLIIIRKVLQHQD